MPESVPPKPRLAVFAGPNATVLNSAPLVTSNKARTRAGLPAMVDAWGAPLRFDQLRPQRLARPATVWVEQFSAHPLEADAAPLHGPPDGWMDAGGEIHPHPTGPDDRPVQRIDLSPEDGLYPLPYMGLRADGTPWNAGEDQSDGQRQDGLWQQGFYPDASRVFEEIDRLGYGEYAESNLLSAHADFDFYRAAPSGGYLRGLDEDSRTDVGDGPIPPERVGDDFFPYRPAHLRDEPSRAMLATITNRVADALASGDYAACLWLEGSPSIEETIYWLSLIVDTAVPIVAVASTEWPHGTLGATGDRNLVHAIQYVRSGIWRGDGDRDRLGAVLIDAERVLTARDVQKRDARPGGFAATGGHGGVVATIGDPGPPVLTNVPVWRATWRSEVRLSRVPDTIAGVTGHPSAPQRCDVATRTADGTLHDDAIPHVTIHKHARFLTSGDADDEVELLARIEHNLRRHRLAGFVVEANAPYGSSAPSVDDVLRRAALSGMPVVRVGRGNIEGWIPTDRMRLAIAGANLTATKARMLLMACLLRFGAPPPAADPTAPTSDEVASVEDVLARYQSVFDTH